MKSFRFSVALSTVLGALFLFTHCKNDVSGYQNNAAFASYIAAHTQGIISSGSSIKVLLQEDFKPTKEKDNSISEEYISFSPSIKGKLYQKDSKTIEFIPEEKLPQNKLYTATLHLQKVNKNVPDSLSTYKFQFKTIKQNFEIQGIGFQSPDGNTKDKYNYVGAVQTADEAKANDVERMIEAAIGNKSYTINWKHDASQKYHQFTVLNIPRKENTFLFISADKDIINAEDNKNKEVKIPSANTFSIIGVTPVSYPEQYISVNFSDPVETMDFEGFFLLDENPQGFKSIVVDGNILKLYPSSPLSGDFKLRINKGITSILGNKLAVDLSYDVHLNSIFPKVEFVGNGNIIPKSNGLYLPFRAVGLNAVTIEITQVFENNVHQFFQQNQLDSDNSLHLVGKQVLKKTIDLSLGENFDASKLKVYQLELSKFIDPQPGAIYNVKFTFGKENASYNCDGSLADTQIMNVLQPEEDNWDKNADNEYYYDEYEYYDEEYDWEQRDNPCHSSYYNSSRFVSKNVLASNLGIIAKIGNDRKCYVSVSDLISADPLSGITIKAYDLQKQIVAQGNTNSDGMCQFSLNRKPFLVVAERGKERGYLRVDDASSLNHSEFDIEGTTLKKGVNGFMYGERGVWRPGDSIFLTFVLNDPLKSFPEKQPVIMELLNPDGQIIDRKVNSNPLKSFYAFKTQTSSEAKTGIYTANFKVGSQLFSKNLQIETIKPNRLKIQNIFSQPVLSLGNTFTLKSNWLSGANAGKLKAKIEATLQRTETQFSGFKGYIFDNPSLSVPSEEFTIFEGFLNEKGEATVQPNITGNFQAPGMMEMGLLTKVFENGGEFSSNFTKKKISPYSSYVGIKPFYASDDSEMLETDKEQKIAIANVDSNGKPLNNDIQIKMYKLENSFWYNSDDSDLAYYNQDSYQQEFVSKTISTINGKALFTFKVPRESWGKYFIIAKDTKSGHSSAIKLWIDWSDWRTRSDENSNESAKLMKLITEKSSYKVGEDIKVTIPSSLEGRALISIENGFSVLKQEWIDTENGSTTYSFEADETMTPNVYVSISMIQPHQKTTNDLPIRSYGTASIAIENPEIKLVPKIASAEEIRPNSKYNITVSEQNGKPMTYTLAVVDEGLLDVTGFNTPDIFTFFNQKQALGVKTFDVYDYVLGAYGGKIESVFAIGGDAYMKTQNKQKINRFTPVVQYLGPFELDGNGSKTHLLSIGKYVGSLKVMVVAGNEGKFGSSEKIIKVKQPVMTLSTLPRTLTPGDELVLPVDVFAMNKNIKKINVSVNANNLIEFTGNNSQSLSFSEEGDQIAEFKLKVKDVLGKAIININSSSGSEKYNEQIEIEVRSPNPIITKNTDKMLASKEVWEQKIESFGIPQTRKATLNLTTLPLYNVKSRLNYLIEYPHGCVEQVTSSAFPQLFLADMIPLSADEQKRVQNNVQTALNKLKNYQMPSGALSYWQNGDYVSDWGTTYALHFVLEAEKKGYALPIGLKENLLKAQKKIATEYAFNAKESYRNTQQAYRLYTLALGKQPEIGLMNRLKENKLDINSYWRLAAAYYEAGNIQMAEKFAQNPTITVPANSFEPYTYGSTVRDEAMILETLTLLGKKDKAFALVKNISQKLNSADFYSTQSTAYSLLAIAKFLGKNGKGNGSIQAEVIINGKVQKINTKDGFVSISIPSDASVSVKNLTSGILFSQLSTSGVPMEENITDSFQNMKMNVQYQDNSGSVIDPTKIAQGTDFKAIVEITNTGLYGDYQNMALTQLFPSGWEIINTRLYTETQAVPNLEYQDFRDDRVYSYFHLPKNQIITIMVHLNATYKGNYYLPATTCNAMYEASVSGIVGGKRVTIF